MAIRKLILGSLVPFLHVVLGCGSPTADPPVPQDAGRHDSAVVDATPHDGARREAGRDAAHDTGPARDASTPACRARASSLQAGLDKVLTTATTPGAWLAVSTPDCGLWVGAAGQSTKTVPLRASDVLRVGSVTKTFVATSVLQLVSRGKVRLTDSLERWVEGFPNGSSITVKELLNHTSGIFDYTQDPTWQATEQSDPSTVWTPQQLVDIAAKQPALFAPGTSWGYSNTDYILLGMLLEMATGDAAGAVLHADAIDEARLGFTTLAGYEPNRGTLAHGFSTSGLDVSTLFDPSYAWTAGAMVSSVGDLAGWAVALYGGSILPPAELASMLDAVPTGTPGEEYGLGVFVLEPSLTGGGVAYGHPGDIDGYHCQMFYFPDTKTAIVGAVNSDAGDPNAVSLVALDLLMP